MGHRERKGHSGKLVPCKNESINNTNFVCFSGYNKMSNITYVKLTLQGKEPGEKPIDLTDQDIDLVNKKIAQGKTGYFAIPKGMANYYLCIITEDYEPSNHVNVKDSNVSGIKRRKLSQAKKIEAIVITNLLDNEEWENNRKSQFFSYYLDSGLYPDISDY